MTGYKRALFYVLLAGLTLAAMEGMARLAYWLAFDEGYGGGTGRAAGEAGRPRELYWRINHPFYSYTYPAAEDDLNRMPPRPGAEDSVVVALVGGSVAQNIVPNLRQALKGHFAAKGWPRRPVVVWLAMRGMKQPQQAIVAANTLALGGDFAILVNLDGHNEIVEGRVNRNAEVFHFFPISWDKGINLPPAETLLAGRIGALRQRQGELTDAITTSPFRYTALFGLAQRYRWERNERRISQRNYDLAAARIAYGLEKHGPRRAFDDAGEFPREQAQAWYRGSLLLAELAELAGAEYYHFQQPSQYVPDSKPLTAEEWECCYAAGSPDERAYRETYPLLRPLGEGLRERGVNYRDLNGIFADNYETLYYDSCCHFNERGKELLAAAIVERIAPALERAATGAPPVSPLTPEAIRDGADELLIDGDFRVYRRAGHWLLYVKEDCAQGDTAERFLLHITPANAADLPPGRREYGFDNRDFEFGEAGIRLEGKCIAERRLPPYAIAGIRTGQYRRGGAILWAGEYHFPRQE